MIEKRLKSFILLLKKRIHTIFFRASRDYLSIDQILAGPGRNKRRTNIMHFHKIILKEK